MALSMYQASIPVFLRGLDVLSTLLDKALAHAEEGGILPEVLLGARLAPDMLPLTAQVQRASDTSKLSVQRLSGVAAPRFEDSEVSFQQLQERIASTVAYLNSVSAAQLELSEERAIALDLGSFQPSFKGDAYLLTFALPNFFFHIATAHGILRNNEVQVGKLDYLGPYE
jgi:hypothetical protein